MKRAKSFAIHVCVRACVRARVACIRVKQVIIRAWRARDFERTVTYSSVHDRERGVGRAIC